MNFHILTMLRSDFGKSIVCNWKVPSVAKEDVTREFYSSAAVWELIANALVFSTPGDLILAVSSSGLGYVSPISVPFLEPFEF